MGGKFASRAAAQPIVKWAGGKRRLVPELLRLIPERYGTYYEPMVGGGALFFALAPRRAVLGDACLPLIEAYHAISARPGETYGMLCELLSCHSPEAYRMARCLWNRGTLRPGAGKAGLFLYLNRACFNGLWRVNASGGFNTPAGSSEHPRPPSRARFLASAAMLANAQIRCGPYWTSADSAGDDDVVYLDPPYQQLPGKGNFTSYTAVGFAEHDQRKLALHATSYVMRGARVIVTNSDTPLIRELYADWNVREVQARRAINSDGAKRGPVTELILWK